MILKLDRIELHHIRLQYLTPFETSFARDTHKECVLVAAYAGGLTGWGECVAESGPWYSYETVETNWHMLRDILAPALLGVELESPAAAAQRFSRVRGHSMARAGIEAAVWDLFGQMESKSLAQMLGATRTVVSVGVSVGIEPTLKEQLARVETFVAQGYKRVKLKIKPGWDVEPATAVRKQFPDLLLQVDANSAYTLADVARFQALDDLQLLLIEQPLHHEDIVDHARLQAQLRTPICLDESIHSYEHARWALDLNACKIINMKVGRVGGFTAALRIHQLCQERGIPLWCGGMLETNIGRAGNVALAALPNFTLPGDISASARYYHEDVAAPDFVLNNDSTLTVPTMPGLGATVLRARLAAARLRHLEIKK